MTMKYMQWFTIFWTKLWIILINLIITYEQQTSQIYDIIDKFCATSTNLLAEDLRVFDLIR